MEERREGRGQLALIFGWQVLDARDPQGTRCYHLDRHLKEHCNVCVLMLLFWFSVTWDSLLSVLRQFACLKSDKQVISVGFFGYPNVKSSVINMLRTKNVCKVAPIPGETKVWRYITLTKRIFLIYCPSVVYQNSDTETDIVLKGVYCAVIDSLSPGTCYEFGGCLRAYWQSSETCEKQHLQRAYKISNWEDDNDFLLQLCKSSGKLLKHIEDVPIKTDLFREAELIGETSEKLPVTVS
ncbi:hypothetical protein BUALT_Bualt18G0052300 [Buddleja alternifolia]|uniref:G domain-containing protein n=1 Tax=Buddleja alternifolia TaxID=168488 RepID=A0AAV6WB74_9LAMI|nr:hypothetical protein BUALT_Bualt18G0052300 [Buddleja alternifolia]